ncbi:MAG: PilX N-terminal domain-containing pilus assembly protein [Pseudomonadota bacterium]
MMQTNVTAIASARNQRGAILVTSLLLLLVLTVLGVAMMKMTNMQERMAGNTRDLNLALQGAEAALRQGETMIGNPALIAPPIATAAVGCTWCQRGALPIDIADLAQFNWPVDAQEFGAVGTQDITQLNQDPRFTIEELAYVQDNETGGTEAPTGRDFYIVTARSTGASGQTNTVLQTTYARRFN